MPGFLHMLAKAKGLTSKQHQQRVDAARQPRKGKLSAVHMAAIQRAFADERDDAPVHPFTEHPDLHDIHQKIAEAVFKGGGYHKAPPAEHARLREHATRVATDTMGHAVRQGRQSTYEGILSWSKRFLAPGKGA